MKVLAIQHDAADPPAAAGEIVTRLGHQLTTIRLDRGDAIPAIADADLLMTFGGGFSFTSGDVPPWFADEQTLIRQYVDSGRRVLGICLGSQMLAAALGAKVRRNDDPEVGWHSIYPVEGAELSGPDAVFAKPMKVFHWHQDTFAIPEGATHILRSNATAHQGFAVNNRVFGLQFHLEANAKTVSTFLMVSKLWKQDARYVQTEREINAGMGKYLEQQTRVLEEFLRVIE